jgi:poly(3-hydroxybutyrate) depolymerase
MLYRGDNRIQTYSINHAGHAWIHSQDSLNLGAPPAIFYDR